MTDKELIRNGQHVEALGNNYKTQPYYILNFSNGSDSDPEELPQRFATLEEAKKECQRLNLQNCFIGNLNTDWL